MIIILILAVLLSFYYLQSFEEFKSGWKNINEKSSVLMENWLPNTDLSTTFSVLIPARNEAQNIQNVILGLMEQDYPKSNFEVIVINDYSNDQTEAIVKELMLLNPNLRIINLADQLKKYQLKKGAIECGIANSNFDYIITTDADCTRNPMYLKSIHQAIMRSSPELISAPVLFTHKNSFFSEWMCFEFLGLNAMGAASISNKKPNMCNGANLLYKKSAFEAVNGFKGNESIDCFKC